MASTICAKQGVNDVAVPCGAILGRLVIYGAFQHDWVVQRFQQRPVLSGIAGVDRVVVEELDPQFFNRDPICPWGPHQIGSLLNSWSRWLDRAPQFGPRRGPATAWKSPELTPGVHEALVANGDLGTWVKCVRVGMGAARRRGGWSLRSAVASRARVRWRGGGAGGSTCRWGDEWTRGG